jgi:hypothetical protein
MPRPYNVGGPGGNTPERASHTPALPHAACDASHRCTHFLHLQSMITRTSIPTSVRISTYRREPFCRRPPSRTRPDPVRHKEPEDDARRPITETHTRSERLHHSTAARCAYTVQLHPGRDGQGLHLVGRVQKEVRPVVKTNRERRGRFRNQSRGGLFRLVAVTFHSAVQTGATPASPVPSSTTVIGSGAVELRDPRPFAPDSLPFVSARGRFVTFNKPRAGKPRLYRRRHISPSRIYSRRLTAKGWRFQQ